jgi:ACS family hexuronate transporter-like MFS transporter
MMVLGWSAAGVLTGFATSFWVLLGCRFSLGFFEAGNWPCGIRTTKAVLRPEERSIGNSLFQCGTALGSIITPLLVFMLLQWADPDEPQRVAVIAVTGGMYEAVADVPRNAWQFPFRVIGSLGVVWVVLWFVTVPSRLLANPQSTPTTTPGTPPTSFASVFRDPRFWALFAMVVAINVTWHGYRTWLPLYLQEQRGLTEAGMSRLTALYYLTASIGSLMVGLGTWALCKGGMSLHGSRIVAFAGCAGLALLTVAVPALPDTIWVDWTVVGAPMPLTPLRLGLLAVAFAGLGLFPTYFSLSQEVSVRHQGKVTGFLGAGAHLSLTLVYKIEGWICEATRSYEPVLAVIGLAPILALGVMLWIWPRDRQEVQ